MIKKDPYCRKCKNRENCDLEEYPEKVYAYGSTMSKNYCPKKDEIKKPTKPKIKKEKTIGELKKELWLVFRDRICYRDNLKCITCTRKISTLNRWVMQCGHFMSKKDYDVMKFDEKNNNAQCSDCNGKTNDRNNAWYGVKVAEKWGFEVFNNIAYNSFWKKSFKEVYGFEPTREYWKERIKEEKRMLKIEKERFERDFF